LFETLLVSSFRIELRSASALAAFITVVFATRPSTMISTASDSITSTGFKACCWRFRSSLVCFSRRAYSYVEAGNRNEVRDDKMAWDSWTREFVDLVSARVMSE